MRRSTTLCGCILASCIAAADAQAQFTQRTSAPAPVSTATEATVGWDWAFSPANAEVATPFGTPNWMIVPQSPANPGQTSKDLRISLQHLIAVPGHSTGGLVETAPGPDAGLVLPGFSRGIGLTTVTRVTIHGRQQHADILNVQVQLPATGDGRVNVRAEHGQSQLPRWSFRPDSNRDGEYVVIASYASDPTERQAPPSTFAEPTVRFGRRTGKQEGDLNPSTPNREQPTNVIVRVNYNPQSETTLAFVVMTEDGRLDKAELGMMTRFFVDDGEYFVPVLMDALEQDLFVAVDLTQWLAADLRYELGEEIDVQEGRSERLPGFLVSRSAAAFTNDAAFVSEDPFSGAVVVSGQIDGSVTDPAGSTLFPLIALITLLVFVAAVIAFRWRVRPAPGPAGRA